MFCSQEENLAISCSPSNKDGALEWLDSISTHKLTELFTPVEGEVMKVGRENSSDLKMTQIVFMGNTDGSLYITNKQK